MMHGIVFPFADWEREVQAVALSGPLRAHTFGQYNLTCIMKGNKVTKQGGMTQGNGQSLGTGQVSFVKYLSCVIAGSLFSPAELFTVIPIKGSSVCL